jgi:hypothetical protein
LLLSYPGKRFGDLILQPGNLLLHLLQSRSDETVDFIAQAIFQILARHFAVSSVFGLGRLE